MHRAALHNLLLLLLPLLTCGQQVIHIENKRLAAVDTGFSGNASVQVNFVQNLNNVLQANSNLNLQYVRGEHSILSLTTYNLSIVNDNRVVNEGFQHFRYNYRWTKPTTIEAYAQLQGNEALKVRFRFLAGAGPRFSVLDRDSVRTRLFVGTSVMAEYEEETTGIVNRSMRLSQFVSVGFPFAKVFIFDAIAYYQPDVSMWSDFRTSIETRLEVELLRGFSLEFRQNVVYDSHPPAGIRNVFYNLSNGVRYRF
jgi:hypothetical protein